ncbi:MAG: dihydroorotate dehydrogenase electron transfer subunit [Clostridiales Family XIII bacterium]|jgi:dihydroorotate dehydrogenase electron transfer subunit|nr:dihydroorotate dehydrogenase electron transfer subunit [Clostridiales Family XIII bacterium]
MSGPGARDILRPSGGGFLAEVLGNERIAADVYRILLEIKENNGINYPEPAPGQFVNVYLNDASRLLPRPISVCDRSEGRPALVFVFGAVGAGTRALAACAPGTALRVGPPAGRGFDLGALRGLSRATLVGGGLGTAPLLFLARALRRAGGVRIRAVLGYESEAFLAREFEAHCDEVHIATDDGSAGFHGTAVGLLKELPLAGGEIFFACGPAPMLRTLSRFAGGQGIPVQVSLEERMGCGYGACLGCVCKLAGEDAAFVNRRVCRDGPVFDGSEVIWDV